MNAEKGISLVELLVALFLSSLVVTSLMYCYLGSKKNYLQIQTALETRFDLNWISDLMRQSIMTAGFTPYANVGHLISRDTRSGHHLTDLVIQSKPYSMIKTFRMHENFTEALAMEGNHLLVSKDYRLRPGKPIIISDAKHAEVHGVEAIKITRQGFKIILTTPLVFNYEYKAYIGEWLEENYTIRPDLNKKPALYFQTARHSEILSTVVSDLTATIETNKSNKLIHIFLKTGNKHSHHIAVRMRNV